MPYMIRGNGGDYKPLSAKNHVAVCVDVVPKPAEDFQGNGDFRPKVKLVFQVAEKREDGKRFTIGKKYTASLHEKAWLRKHLDSWRGRPFTPKEGAEFDLENVIGKSCMIQVCHQAGDSGRVYAYINHIMPLPDGATPLVPEDYMREQDRPGWKPPVDPEPRSEDPLHEEQFEAEIDQVPF